MYEKISNMQKNLIKIHKNAKLFESRKYKSRTYRIKCMYVTPNSKLPSSNNN